MPPSPAAEAAALPPATPDRAHPGAAPLRERVWALALLGGLLALRVVYAFHREFDSDEPQHLHVVWAWTRGLLPYRDVLDNHAPLFHLLMAPLLAAVGERADALVAMRFAMFPLFGLVLLSVAWLGHALFSPRVGLWAAVIAAAWPEHFLTSLEFRADDLWAALWLLSLVALFTGRRSAGRAFLAGALAGAAAAVSFKTSLLLVTLGAAMLAARIVVPGPRARDRAGGGAAPGVAAAPGPEAGAGGRAARALVAWLLGFAIVPAALAAFFAARGAFDTMVQATITGNTLSGLWRGDPRRPLLLPLLAPLALWIASRLARGADGRGRARAALFLSGAAYYLALVSYWPLLTRQDYLPVVPLAALTIAAFLFPSAAAPRRSAQPWAALGLVGAGIVALLAGNPPWQDRTAGERRLIGDVLALTGPDEYVMDLKGESVFRPRPVFWVLETVTQERFRRGLLPDEIAGALIPTHTAVAVPDHYKLPPRMRDFLNANYLQVGAVRVLGRRLAEPAGGAAPAPLAFTLEIPARYQVVAAGRPAAGRLDGVPAAAARWLDAGRHEYLPAPGERDLAVIWARASEKGYAAPPPPPETR